MNIAPAATRVIASTPKQKKFCRRPEMLPTALVAIVCLTVGAINSRFYQLSTLFDLARSCTVVGLFALGVLIVLAAGGIDVSFTAIAALTMYSLTKLALHGWPEAPFFLILLAGGLSGALLGCLNGFLIHTLKAPSLIVTIGTQYLFRGILLTFVGTAFFMDIPKSMVNFGQRPLLQHLAENGSTTVLPATFLILVGAAILSHYLLTRTLMGRAIYALGGSMSIAERLGYPLRVIHLFVFSFAGFLAGIAGIVHVSSNRLANPFDLVGTELDVIAAVILGGARITGGTGTVTGTLLGVGLVVLINNVLILAGVPSTWQKLILGTFILFAGGFAALKRTP